MGVLGSPIASPSPSPTLNSQNVIQQVSCVWKIHEYVAVLAENQYKNLKKYFFMSKT